MPSWVKDEDKWRKAEEVAEREGKGNDYAFITGVYKKMGGEIMKAENFREALQEEGVIKKKPDEQAKAETVDVKSVKDESKQEGKFPKPEDLSFKEALMIEEVLKDKSPEELAEYPWDQCIKDQMKKYGSKETAEKVCGYIKSKYGG